MRSIFIIFLLSFILFPSLSFADEGFVPCGGEGQPECELCHFFVLFNNIVVFFLKYIIPPIAILLVTIGGLMLYFSGDNPSLQGNARTILFGVAIGLAIIYGAWLIVNTFLTVIGVEEWTGLDTWFSYPSCP